MEYPKKYPTHTDGTCAQPLESVGFGPWFPFKQSLKLKESGDVNASKPNIFSVSFSNVSICVFSCSLSLSLSLNIYIYISICMYV